MRMFQQIQETVSEYCDRFGGAPTRLVLSAGAHDALKHEVEQKLTTPGSGWPASYLGLKLYTDAENKGISFSVARADEPGIMWHETDEAPPALSPVAIPQDNRNDAETGEKPSNPKDIIGSDKLPLHLWPTTATAMGCLGFLEGAVKYGRSNFRAVGVRASIYVDAAKRHLDAWFEGEDVAPDTGTPHLSSALACLAIIVDAQAHDKLRDDRNFAPNAGYRALVERLTPHVKALKDQFKDMSPKHYQISDKVSE